jgi:hypothetical protein
MERAELYEGTRVGVEVTHGTGVKATMILPGIAFTPNDVEAQGDVTSKGLAAAIGTVRTNGSHTEIPFTGIPNFHTMIAMLATFYCKPVISSPTPGVERYFFAPKPRCTNPLESFTMDTGGCSGGERAQFAITQTMQLSFSSEEGQVNSLTGSMFAMPTAYDGIVMEPDANLVYLPSVPMANTWSIYVTTDPARANIFLAANERKDAFEYNFSCTNRNNRVNFGRIQGGSFSNTVEDYSECMGGLTISRTNGDADVAYMNALRKGQRRYTGFRCVGPVIIGAFKYKMDIVFPFDFRDTQKKAVQKTAARSFALKTRFDPIFNGYLEITIDIESGSNVLTPGVALGAGQDTKDIFIGQGIGI